MILFCRGLSLARDGEGGLRLEMQSFQEVMAGWRAEDWLLDLQLKIEGRDLSCHLILYLGECLVRRVKLVVLAWKTIPKVQNEMWTRLRHSLRISLQVAKV